MTFQQHANTGQDPFSGIPENGFVFGENTQGGDQDQLMRQILQILSSQNNQPALPPPPQTSVSQPQQQQSPLGNILGKAAGNDKLMEMLGLGGGGEAATATGVEGVGAGGAGAEGVAGLGGAGGAGIAGLGGAAAIAAPVAAVFAALDQVRKNDDESIGRQLTHPGLTPQRLLESADLQRRSEQALGGEVGGGIAATAMAGTELMGGDFSNAFRRLRKDVGPIKSIDKLFRSIF